MFVGGLNIIRNAVAQENPLQKGMGNKSFAEYYCPVTLTGGGMSCRLMSDPLIAVERSNEVAKRSVAKPKRQGSIKESWAVGDWNVNISGVIVANDKDELMDAIRQLQSICALRESVEITCEPLNTMYDITRIAIDRIQLPFTQGPLNQQFTIEATSDTSYELLEEI